MFRLLFTAILLTMTTAVQWSDTLPHQAVVTTCSGSDLHLPWNFTLPAGQRVEDIKWIYQATGRDDEVIALFAAGHFVVMPAFSGRVQRMGEGGIVVSNASLLESGNYTVVVSTDDATNPLAKDQRTANVQVVDLPKTESGKLEVEQRNEAVYDDTTGKHHVSLTCGVFSDLGHPAVNVLWTTPDGQQLQSSSVHNGTFQLLLPNPPSGGNYTCTLPPLSPATHCLPPPSPLLDGATVTVDQVKASFAILEAKQTELQTQVDVLKQENEAVKRENEEMKNELRNISSLICNDSSLTELSQLMSKLEGATQQIGFHARLPVDISIDAYNVIKPWKNITNQGQAFNPTTGTFVAPFNGFYFFAASSGSAVAGGYANLGMMKEGVGVCYTWVREYSVYWSMGSCHATLHLLVGEGVWLISNIDDGYFDDPSTSFSGFLISADI